MILNVWQSTWELYRLTHILTIPKEVGDRVLKALVDPKYLMGKKRKSNLLLQRGGEGLSPGTMLACTTQTQCQSLLFIHLVLTEWLIRMCKACPGNCGQQKDELKRGPL